MIASAGCKAGYFGWGCRFRCDCLHGGNCDSTTGHCETGCSDGRWGIGCLLGNFFSYLVYFRQSVFCSMMQYAVNVLILLVWHRPVLMFSNSFV